MYKKILAPLDGSELSECSLEHVRAIASGCQVPEVVLLMVIEPLPQIEEVGEDWRRNAEKKAEADAKTYLSRLAGDLTEDGLSVSTATIHGRAGEEILNYANKNNADLIILSTHGRAGISRWVFGSVAERIIRHSKVPVLTVSPAGCRRG